MTPDEARQVFIRLAREHERDSEAVAALEMAIKQTMLTARGYTTRSMVFTHKQAVAPGARVEVRQCAFEPMQPRWLELPPGWRLERWYIGDCYQGAVVPILNACGKYDTIQRGYTVGLYVINTSNAPATFYAELVGYGFPVRHYPSIHPRQPLVDPIIEEEDKP